MAIQEQVEAGLYSLKRYAFYLKKITDGMRPMLKEMIADTEHENEKKNRIDKDRMTNHVSAYRRMQDVHLQHFQAELKFATALNDSVVEPLLAWHKNAERRREALVKREAQVRKDYQEVLAKLTAQRQTCLKLWASLQAAKREVAKADSVKDTKKTGLKDLQAKEKDFDKERQKTEAAFKQLEAMLGATQQQQVAFWSRQLPAVVQDWERFETERLSVFGSHIALYASLQRQRVQPLTEGCETLEAGSAALDGAAELNEFVQSIVRVSGEPVPPAPIADELPCASAQLLQDSVELTQLLALDPVAAVAKRAAGLPSPGYAPWHSAGPAAASSGYGYSAPEDLYAAAAPAAAAPSANYYGGGGAAVAAAASAPEGAAVEGESKSGSVGASSAGPTVVCYVRAAFTFEAADKDDLPFKDGDIIAVLEKPDQGDDTGAWWTGAIVQPDGSLGGKGSFPSNYVEPCERPQ